MTYKLYKNLDYWSGDILNFKFSEKDLGLVSPSHFARDFQEKYFLCYILLTDQIYLSDCLYFLKYWAICVSQLFVNRAVTSWNLKLTLSFLSSHFCYTTKKSRQKLTYLENEKSFRGEIKDIFIIFKGLSVLKNCLGPESVPLKQKRLDWN